jgi:hypothetical protein
MARGARRTIEGWLHAVVQTKRWSKSALASKPTITVQEIQLMISSCCSKASTASDTACRIRLFGIHPRSSHAGSSVQGDTEVSKWFTSQASASKKKPEATETSLAVASGRAAAPRRATSMLPSWSTPPLLPQLMRLGVGPEAALLVETSVPTDVVNALSPPLNMRIFLAAPSFTTTLWEEGRRREDMQGRGEGTARDGGRLRGGD